MKIFWSRWFSASEDLLLLCGWLLLLAVTWFMIVLQEANSPSPHTALLLHRLGLDCGLELQNPGFNCTTTQGKVGPCTQNTELVQSGTEMWTVRRVDFKCWRIFYLPLYFTKTGLVMRQTWEYLIIIPWLGQDMWLLVPPLIQVLVLVLLHHLFCCTTCPAHFDIFPGLTHPL